MEVKPGYKQTEVGVIPEDWVVRTFNKIGAPVRGGSPRPAGDPKYFNGSYIPWLTVSALTNISVSKLFVTETESCLTEEGSLRSRMLFPGTLIIANSGATLGVAKILGILCCANDGIAAIINLEKKICPKYCAYFINTKTKYLREVVATGNGQPNLNTGLIGNFYIPLPPTLAEQEAIAGALSDADALIESLERLIEKKRRIKQGAMQELLTGKRRLPGFTDKWEVKKLGDVLTRLSNGAVYRPTNNLGYAITRIETISDGKIDYSRTGRAAPDVSLEQFRMLPGDILFSHINSLDHIGKVAFFFGEKELIHGMNLLLLRTNTLAINIYLYFYLTSTPARSTSKKLAKQAVSQASINTTELREIELLLPSIAEQTAIADILSDMDAEIAALETKLAKARDVKLGMMQELLTGRIRLI